MLGSYAIFNKNKPPPTQTARQTNWDIYLFQVFKLYLYLQTVMYF